MSKCKFCGEHYNPENGHSCMESRMDISDSTTLIRKDEKTGISVKVEWYNAGEGLQGDYNPDDPDDINLLRFDVYKKEKDAKEWEPVDDASYCTQLPDEVEDWIKVKGLEMLMDEVFEPLVGGNRIKKLCEMLSWISEDNIKNGTWDVRQHAWDI